MRSKDRRLGIPEKPKSLRWEKDHIRLYPADPKKQLSMKLWKSCERQIGLAFYEAAEQNSDKNLKMERIWYEPDLKCGVIQSSGDLEKIKTDILSKTVTPIGLAAISKQESKDPIVRTFMPGFLAQVSASKFVRDLKGRNSLEAYRLEILKEETVKGGRVLFLATEQAVVDRIAEENYVLETVTGKALFNRKVSFDIQTATRTIEAKTIIETDEEMADPLEDFPEDQE